jgi:hypothetical protein
MKNRKKIDLQKSLLFAMPIKASSFPGLSTKQQDILLAAHLIL